MEPDDFELVSTSEPYEATWRTNKHHHAGTKQKLLYRSVSTGIERVVERMVTHTRMWHRDRSKYSPKECFAKGNR